MSLLKVLSCAIKEKWLISHSLPVPVALVLGTGISLSILITMGVSRMEYVQQQQSFDRKADSLAFAIQRSLDNPSQVVSSLRGFFEATEEMTPEKFKLFTHQVLQDSPELLNVGFAQRVLHSNRDILEQKFSRREITSPLIWESDHTARLKRSPQEEEYIVTTYIEPFAQHQQLIGYNHRSDWRRWAAISKARNSDIMVTTKPVPLPTLNRHINKGFVVYQPIYRQAVKLNNIETRQKHFLGVVYGTFQLEYAIAIAIKELDWQDLDFYLYDLDIDRLESALVKDLTSLEHRFLVVYDAHTQKIIQNPYPKRIYSPLINPFPTRRCPYSRDWTVCLRTLNLQGQEWSVLIVPKPKPWHSFWSIWMTLMIGLLLTLMLSLYLWMSIRRARQAEKLVQALQDASSDPLTGLANRREFEKQLEIAMMNAAKKEQSHTLCFMDLDRFKIVNDICGHGAGDCLLIQVSQLIKHHIRKSDLLARLGGDEFGLLLRYCTLEESRRVAEGILQALTAFQFTWEQKTFKLGISLGLTSIHPESNDIGEVLRRADKACYRAKQNGRNCIVISDKIDQENSHKTSHGLEWLTWLNEGLTDEFLELYCQPTLALKSELTHNYVEILLRLRNRPEVSLSLAEFIQDAERYQVMPTVDRWVLQTFLRYLSFFVKETNLAVNWEQNIYAINLSGLTLNDQTFADFCRDQLIRYDIPPQVICFEITENIAIANFDKTNSLISKLKALGCRFALDDFGRGMSSLAYLRDLPIDYLKVDGSFIVNLTDDRITYNIVDTIAKVGQILGIQTIAEFVENEQLLQELQLLGFDYAQGYGVAMPIHLDNHFVGKLKRI